MDLCCQTVISHLGSWDTFHCKRVIPSLYYDFRNISIHSNALQVWRCFFLRRKEWRRWKQNVTLNDGFCMIKTLTFLTNTPSFLHKNVIKRFCSFLGCIILFLITQFYFLITSCTSCRYYPLSRTKNRWCKGFFESLWCWYTPLLYLTFNQPIFIDLPFDCTAQQCRFIIK